MTKKKQILPLLFCILFFACSEPETEPPVFSLPEDVVSLGATKGVTRCSFITNSDWSASSDTDWLKVYPESGSAKFLKDHILYLSVEENPAADRDCYVVIRSNGEEKRIHVLQQHAPFFLNNKQFDLSYDQQKISVPLFSEGEVITQIDGSGNDWIQPVKTRAPLENDTLWFEISANRSGTRNANLFLTYGGKTETVQVRQDAHLVPIEDNSFRNFCCYYLDVNGDGQFCIDDAERVTEIGGGLWEFTDLSGGWEYFTHLKKIDVRAAKASSFDFRFFTELESVELTAPVPYPDLSTNKNLRSLSLHGIGEKVCLKNLNSLTYLSIFGYNELDLDGTSNLESFTFATDKEALDIGYQPHLKSFTVKYSHNLKTINTSQFPAVTEVYLQNNSILETLDLTFQPNLYSLSCLENKSLKTIYVKKMPEVTYIVDSQVSIIVVE